MRIRSVRHCGLRRFIERNDARGLSASQVERIRNMVTALLTVDGLDELPALPGWRLHRLRGRRQDQ